jgi:serine/threonine protein phosphatase PrpC
MRDQNQEIAIESASVSDRGLSEKRPLNEDSFLADTERRIFAVADGVGGAQAGEVASQTAMEVLEEAFRHNIGGADIEDLMEIAIQRANASIHRMSHEHPKLSMMATTIVALHLDGRTATIGHVGDSRLYRLSPDGNLHRETRDHSVVEEEVRAGRMTPDQAANHPSRNVISRALGAEETVEVDLKMIEVDEGTAFLLCSDGVTRHIGDAEIRGLMRTARPLNDICEEMKRRCYERGAEDNLTAVIVRVGQAVEGSPEPVYDEEPTISTARPTTALAATQIGFSPAVPQAISPPPAPSRVTFTAAPDPEVPTNGQFNSGAASHSGPPPITRRGKGRALSIILGVLTILLVSGAAIGGFLLGKMRAEQQMRDRAGSVVPAPALTPAEPTSDEVFDKKRREVDHSPQEALRKMQAQASPSPMASNDPEFLYLYGRALLLTGRPMEANEALKKAVNNLKDRSPRDPVKVDSKLSAAVAALRTGNWQAAQNASKQIEEVIELEDQGVEGPAGLHPTP